MTVRAIILDVDGVLTDGRLYYTESGESIKVFHVHDGSAIKAWRSSGGRVALISGRRSPMVQARADELGIDRVVLGAEDKVPPFKQLLRDWDLEPGQACYVGDDLPDLAPMSQCGYPVAVANAVEAVKKQARYVTRTPGGHGAVREVVEHLQSQSSA